MLVDMHLILEISYKEYMISFESNVSDGVFFKQILYCNWQSQALKKYIYSSTFNQRWVNDMINLMF